MSYRTTPRNYKSAKFNTSAAYVEVTADIQSYFSVYAPAEGLFLSIGHDTPTDGTSITVPAGSAFSLETGIIGKVFVKSLTGVAVDANVVYA